MDTSFEEFVIAASPGLSRLAYRLTGDPHDAEDLLQGALWKVSRRWSVARDSPIAYTRQALVQLAKDGWKSQSRRPREVFGLLPDVAIATPDLGDRYELMQALRHLPARQRAVVVLRYWEDLSVAQTAELLDCTEGTVKSTAHKALESLRTFLNAQEAAP